MYGAGTAWSANQAKMSPTPVWPASYPQRPATMPPSTTPHMPGTSASAVPFITWQLEVPMMMTIWPAAIAFAAGGVTCASTFPTATAIPSGRPVHAAACPVSEPARAPSGETGWASLSSAKPANSGLSAARNSRDG